MAGYETEVRDQTERSRYVVSIDGQPAGFAIYRPLPGRVVFVHTEIDTRFSGHGVGSALARGALDDVRRRGMLVTVHCPFIAAYIRRHPEYADLVEDALRGQVEP